MTTETEKITNEDPVDEVYTEDEQQQIKHLTETVVLAADLNGRVTGAAPEVVGVSIAVALAQYLVFRCDDDQIDAIIEEHITQFPEMVAQYRERKAGMRAAAEMGEAQGTA